MSTRYYLDSKWPELTPTQPSIKKVVEEVNEVNEIDEDIEKQIRQLQEQKFQKGIQNVLPKEVDILGNRLDSFLSTVQVEKEQLEEKVKKEEIKIGALEDLFATLKKEKKKPVEEKKIEPTKVEIKEEPKKVEANSVKAQEIKAASNLLEYLLPKEVEKYDEGIIDKVSHQISEMKVANELEKDKISKLKSIDTLEKLTEEFLKFKNITSVQLSTLGGGGSIRILDNDDVDISSIGDGKILEYDATTKKMKFVASSSGTNNVTIPNGGTIGSVGDTDAISIATGGDTTFSQNVVVTGNLTVSGSTTTIDSSTISVTDSFVFEGATADDYETTLNVVDPTADRTITLPNVSGTLPVLAVASTTQISSTPEELNILDGVSSTAAELNILDGVSSTTAELNLVDGSSAGTIVNSKAVVYSSAGQVNATTLAIAGTALTASATELNYVDGVTGNIQTAIDAKATKAFAIAQAVALG